MLMDSIAAKCVRINSVFEDMFIYKSIIVTNNPSVMYHMETILKKQLYPIDRLTFLNLYKVLDAFQKGNLRMLIMSEGVYRILCERHPSIYDDVNVVFDDDTSVPAPSDKFTTDPQAHKIFSLSM